MMPISLGHIALRVFDIKKSLLFYKQVFGAQIEIERLSKTIKDESGCPFYVAFIKFGNTTIELFSSTKVAYDINNKDIFHIAFFVINLKEFSDHLDYLDISYETHQIDEQKELIRFFDPDNFIIEVMEHFSNKI
ncbi:MAG: VOC family protein [Patescibacteria group bacterium]|nr:VOC family protein [Patescibacteria group bacterium]MDD4304509.1 VOC family protein [Patescibacteria group bacterium]MDD4694869.1 VOC family protein [Patescibacteria group bacterium]